MSAPSALALANTSIAITRPVSQAKSLTQLIQDAGGNVIPFPLIDIVPLADYSTFESTIETIGKVDWLLFISSNAVQNSMPRLIKKGVPSTVKFAAIGPKTAQALNQLGINDVLIPGGHQKNAASNQVRFDSESLLSLPEMQDMQDKNVMIVRGIGGREVLGNTLKSRGATVTLAECYQRVNPQTNCDLLAKAYASHRLQSIVVTSSEAMRHLLDLAGLGLTNHATWLKDIIICVNHQRIAEQPLKIGLKVAVAEAPGDGPMLDLLLKLHIEN